MELLRCRSVISMTSYSLGLSSNINIVKAVGTYNIHSRAGRSGLFAKVNGNIKILCFRNFTDDSYQYLQKSKVPSYHFQKSLLRLPIPELEKTCSRYLRCQKAFLSDTEYAATEKYVEEFKKTVGPDLQAKLKLIDSANKHTSYICKHWFDMYLSDRVPVVFNYNPCMSFLPEERVGYGSPVIRASNFLISSVRFMHSLRDSVLEPEVYHLNPAKSNTSLFHLLTRCTPSPFASYAAYAFKAFPLDMSQYSNLFNSTRIPEMEIDRIASFPEACHTLVMKNGNFYVFDIFDSNGNICSPSHLHACMSYIYYDNMPVPDYPIGILTTENRDVWAKLRNELVVAGNEDALKMIDSSAFNIVFDSTKLDTMDFDKGYKTFLHGDGFNRWFDKSFSLIFTDDGSVALNFEHSWGDGVAIMRYINEVAKDSVENSFIHPSSSVSHIDASQYVKRLDFNITPSIADAIKNSISKFNKTANSLATDYFISDSFGKPACKKLSVSPDAVMQLGFQVAYYLLNGSVPASYESCSTAAFRHGRTETVRPTTLETRKFSQAVSNNKCKKAELKSLLVDCSKMHNQLTKDAAMGQGFDRHLFALKLIAQQTENELPALYMDPSFNKLNHIIVSTSTLPSPAIWYGGFGPVVKDGFGIGYRISDKEHAVMVSYCPQHANGADFVECFSKASKLIYDTLI